MSNIWMTWGDVFNASLQNLWWGFIQFAPRLVMALVFFIVGWALGNIVARALEQGFRSLKVDNMLRSIGVENFFRKAGINLNSGYFIGEVVKWFIIIVFLIPSLDLVGLNSIKDFLQND